MDEVFLNSHEPTFKTERRIVVFLEQAGAILCGLRYLEGSAYIAGSLASPMSGVALLHLDIDYLGTYS